MVLQLENVFFAEPVLIVATAGAVLTVHAQSGLLSEETRLDGPFLRQERGA